MKRQMAFHRIIVWKAIAPFAVIALTCAAWADQSDTTKLTSFVTPENIRQHLEALQEIADGNGGNRETGTAGDEATRDYIAEQLEEAGLIVTRQEFTFDYFREIAPAILERIDPSFFAYEEGEPNSSADFHVATSSGNGDVTASIQATVDVVIPPGEFPNSNTSGCEADDFSGFTPGNIALIQRGTCTFRQKVHNAIDAGAAGVVLFNEGTPEENSGGADRIGLIGANLGQPAVTIPVVFARFAVGEELYNLLNDPNLQGPVTVHLKTNTELVSTTTENIFGETPAGNANKVVMAGAHLDSVADGPGINDNGTGMGTLLEIAKGLNELEISPVNKVRFAFWGAEEPGQVGSDVYVGGLSSADKSHIKAYLNFDITGSPNFAAWVYDSDGNTVPPAFGPSGGNLAGKAEQVFVDYFNGIGKPATLRAIDQRSDYKAFLLEKIPFAAITSGFDGLKTAAEAAVFGGDPGEPYDPCYHQACDTIDNVSDESLDLMKGAAVHAIMTFATKAVIFP